MRILVTGSAGFIASHLVRALLNKKHRVIGIDNLNPYYNPGLKKLRLTRLIGQSINFKFYRKDINDRRFLEKLFNKEKFEIVFHLAAQAGIRYSLINPLAYEKSNLKGLLTILEVIRKSTPKPKLIFASSSSVYGNSKIIPFSEDDPCNKPASLYSVTKRCGELMIKTYHHLFGIKSCCLRFFTVYGPWGRPDMAYYSFTRNLFNHKPITLFQKDTQRDFTYIDDIIDALIKIMAKKFNFEIINLGNSKPVTLSKFMQILEKETGKKANLIIKRLPKEDVKKTFADIQKAKKLLNWQPETNIEMGLKHFVSWYKNYILNNPLLA